jgi:hypothetical protein
MRPLARLFVLIALTAACSPAAPTPQENTPPPPPPPAPIVTAVSPALGSADGGAPIRIDGINLFPGTIVRFGGVVVTVTFWNGSLYGGTPPHAAGLVDVEVENQNQRSVLAGAYTFIEPDELDFNGLWQGYFGESELRLSFTVENGIVTSVSCGGVSLALSPSPAIHRGRFTYAGTGSSVEGRILAPNEAAGTITMPSCVDPFGTDWWYATKDGASGATRRRR